MAEQIHRRDGASADGSASRAVLTIDGPIAEIALDGGPLNLVNAQLLRSLASALSDVAAATAIRCVILHGGAARAFCAGSDIHELATLHEDASERKILFEDMVLRRLARLPMPTIAAIDGPAIGGGFELALACDLRIARRGAKIGLSESRLGGLAGNGAVRLTRLIGPARAKELLYTGDTLAAEQALAWGAINASPRTARRSTPRGRLPRPSPHAVRCPTGSRRHSPMPRRMARSTPHCRCRPPRSSRSSTAPTCTRASRRF
jgi:enoyl-CoA hydratase/carnithine racemase